LKLKIAEATQRAKEDATFPLKMKVHANGKEKRVSARNPNTTQRGYKLKLQTTSDLDR
jgi:hypothetical protein